MRTRLYGTDINEMLIEANYPDMFHDTASGISERSFSGDIFFGKGTYREIYFEGVHIGYGDMELTNNTLLHFESDFETVEMHFSLRGETQTNGGNFKDVNFGCNQHNILYVDGFKGNINWAASKQMQVFEVNLLPSFFKRYLPDEILKFNLFSKNLEKKQSAFLNNHNLRITPQMLQLINDIISCDRTGKFKRMIIEAKVIELLLLQLEQMSDHECETFCSLKKEDVHRMYEAKEIILKNISTPCSLINLAQQVGTNEFTLKKGFKEIFGTTVFGFWNDVKMQEAKILLLDNSISVAAVSEQIGYKNPQHFSTAFKKYFGTSPSQLKN